MVTDWLMNPLRFAYQAGRGVKDAKIFILDTIYKHQGTPDTAARLLFADFSSNHAATHSSWESHHLLSTWPPTHPVDHRLSYRVLVRGKRECWLTTPSLKSSSPQLTARKAVSSLPLSSSFTQMIACLPHGEIYWRHIHLVSAFRSHTAPQLWRIL